MRRALPAVPRPACCLAHRASPSECPLSRPPSGRPKAQSGPSGLWSRLLNSINHPRAPIAAVSKHCGEWTQRLRRPVAGRPGPRRSRPNRRPSGRRRALSPCTPPTLRLAAAPRAGPGPPTQRPQVAAPGWLAVGKTGDSTTASARSRRAWAMPRRPCAAVVKGRARRGAADGATGGRETPRQRAAGPARAAPRGRSAARPRPPPAARGAAAGENGQAGQVLRREAARHHPAAPAAAARGVARVRQTRGIA